VLHDWFMPSFGVQKEAVTGRINETWFKAEKIGTYYGQCNELCGQNHGFMPITVDVVSKDDFAKWLADAKKKYASLDQPTITLAKASDDVK
jgi:cytochrome c oxidase subunit II